MTLRSRPLVPTITFYHFIEDRDSALQSDMEAGAAETMDSFGEILKEINKG